MVVGFFFFMHEFLCWNTVQSSTRTQAFRITAVIASVIYCQLFLSSWPGIHTTQIPLGWSYARTCCAHGQVGEYNEYNAIQKNIEKYKSNTDTDALKHTDHMKLNCVYKYHISMCLCVLEHVSVCVWVWVCYNMCVWMCVRVYPCSIFTACMYVSTCNANTPS